MNSIANLQSSLSLLTSLTSPRNANKGLANSATPISSDLNLAADSPISGSVDRAVVSAQSGAVWSLQILDGQATGSFQDHGDDSTAAALAYRDEQTDLADNFMTSQQLSDAVYSVEGVPFADGSVSNTFMGELRSLSSNAEYAAGTAQNMEAWAAEGMPVNNSWGFVASAGQTPDQLTTAAKDLITDADQEISTYNQIEAAYDSHTLTIQNAVDVQGLDYSSTWTASSSEGSMVGGLSQSINEDFVNNNPDGKQHTTMSLGDAAIYLTW